MNLKSVLQSQDERVSDSNYYGLTRDDDGLPGGYRDDDSASPPLPDRIGRYVVERILGKGGFGLVYLARDDQLDRLVAIKVPHERLVSRREDAEACLS